MADIRSDVAQLTGHLAELNEKMRLPVGNNGLRIEQNVTEEIILMAENLARHLNEAKQRQADLSVEKIASLLKEAQEYVNAIENSERRFDRSFWGKLGDRVRRRMPWLVAALTAMGDCDWSITISGPIPPVITITVKKAAPKDRGST